MGGSDERFSAIQPVALAATLAFGATLAKPPRKSPSARFHPPPLGWPGVVANAKGFFAENGIEWDVVSIGVSPGQQAVASGSLNIMHNTCNAVVSFMERGGQRSAPVDGGRVAASPACWSPRKA